MSGILARNPFPRRLINQHYRDIRKIDPTQGATLADGSPNNNDRVEIGPTQLAFAEWAKAKGGTDPAQPACRESISAQTELCGNLGDGVI